MTKEQRRYGMVDLRKLFHSVCRRAKLTEEREEDLWSLYIRQYEQRLAMRWQRAMRDFLERSGVLNARESER